MYNFCDDFNIEACGRTVDAVFCYRISSPTGGPLFRIGYVKDEQYHEIEIEPEKVKFERRVIG